MVPKIYLENVLEESSLSDLRLIENSMIVKSDSQFTNRTLKVTDRFKLWTIHTTEIVNGEITERGAVEKWSHNMDSKISKTSVLT